MASDLDCGNELAFAALAEMTVAAAVIPAAWPCVELLVINQSDPGGIYATGQTWLKLGAELGNVATAYDNTAGKLPRSSWDSTDRDAFDQRIGDETTQLHLTQAVAITVGICLIVMAIALFVLIILMFVLATILAFLAAAILLVMAGVITAPAAAMLEFEADFTAGDAFAAIEGAANLTGVLSHSCAAVISAAMAADVGGQAMNGNDHIGEEALGTLLSSVDDIYWGAMSRVERDTTAKFAGQGNGLSILLGGADARSSSGMPVGTDHARSAYDQWLDSNR
jgi:hypothetical protein